VIGIVVLGIAVILGWLAARLLTSSTWGAGLPATLLQVSLGVLFGPAILSLICFLLVPAGLANPVTLWIALGVLTAAAAGAAFRHPTLSAALPETAAGWRWNGLLILALGVGLALFLATFYAASAGNPAGYWDAFAIWNLRARFLAGGPETWRYAFSPGLSASHPGYPLLLSASIAAESIAGGGVAGRAISGGSALSSISIANALVFALAVLAMLVSAIAARRGWALGLLAGLVLLATDSFAAQAPNQYSDLPLALCFLASLVLLERAAASQSGVNQSTTLFAAAGIAAGLAPWTKNEGWPFWIALVALVAWRWGARPASWTLLGSIPGVAATLAMKVFLVTSSEAMFPKSAAEAFAKIADPARWWKIIVGFATAVWRLGPPWAHPVVLLAALIVVLGWVSRKERASALWLLAPLGAVAAADFVIFLMTTNDLQWHLDTSVDRLLLQLWPALLFVVFLNLQRVEELTPHKSASPARESRTRPRKKSSRPGAPFVEHR
jgi:hypothetical protein